MSFWSKNSNFRLNYNGAQPLLTHEKAFYLDTIHPVTRDYVTPTRIFPLVRHKAKTVAEMRQEIEDAWKEACVQGEERERQLKLQAQSYQGPKVAAQRRQEEARQKMEQERQEIEKLKNGRVFSEIVKLMEGYTVEQISANPKLRGYFIKKIPTLLHKNAQRISELKQMLDERRSPESAHHSL